MTNSDIARRLMTFAREMESEGGNLFRIRSYRAAASLIERMLKPISDLWAERGREGIEALPGIGKSLAYTIEGLIREGELQTLKPADAGREPERLFASLPGVGPKLAEELRDTLGLKSLEELRLAAEAGRLVEVGVGKKRLNGILAALRQSEGCIGAPKNEPALKELLATDEAFRTGTQSWQGCHVEERNGWTLKALHANTALAHRLEKTRDWVVVYFQQGDKNGQRTVVTESGGDLTGRRVVRGRERECRVWYGVGAMTHEPAA